MGLPIRRPKPKEKQIVLAFPDELDAWVRQQAAQTAQETCGVDFDPTDTIVEQVTTQHNDQLVRALNLEGLERMQVLLEQLLQQTRVAHERAEDLCKKQQRLPTNHRKTARNM